MLNPDQELVPVPYPMASSYRLLDAANSNTFEGFLQHGARRLKKRLCSVAGSSWPFRFNR